MALNFIVNEALVGLEPGQARDLPEDSHLGIVLVDT